MNSSILKMWLSCLLASSVISLATAANEYLPPSKGYHYDPPNIPFPPNNNNVHKPPSPPPTPYRPTPPPRPTYVPPPQPGPGPRPTPGPGPRPTPGPDHHHHDGDHHDHDHHHHHEPGMPFDFAYAVNEDGNDYSHNAVSDGDVTRGQYRVALPDGRVQVVKYTADWKNGFNAEVTYEGEARYPDQPAGGYGNGPSSGGQGYVPPAQGGGYQY